MRVDLREIGDRLDDREHEERQQRQSRPRFRRAGVERGARFLERGDVDLLDVGEVGDASGFGHFLGDAAAQAYDLDGLDRGIGRSSRRLRRRFGPAGDIGVEVLTRDASRGARAAHESEIDAGLARLQAHRGRGERLLAGRARRPSLRVGGARRR
jgi:hypothetical protein